MSILHCWLFEFWILILFINRYIIFWIYPRLQFYTDVLDILSCCSMCMFLHVIKEGETYNIFNLNTTILTGDILVISVTVSIRLPIAYRIMSLTVISFTRNMVDIKRMHGRKNGEIRQSKTLFNFNPSTVSTRLLIVLF